MIKYTLNKYRPCLYRVSWTSKRYPLIRSCQRSIHSTKPINTEYNWINGLESLNSYMPGGYHPVMIDQILHNRYRIIDKLGYGGYSTVWLTLDQHNNRFVALKVCMADSSHDEIKVLKILNMGNSYRNDQHFIPQLLDEFTVDGPNGTHPCYAMTPTLCNIRTISFSQLFPIDVARALCYQLVRAVGYIHSQGYVHGGSVKLFLGYHQIYQC